MNHHDTIKKSFTIQAEKFVSYHMAKELYTRALEVAAGTCYKTKHENIFHFKYFRAFIT